MAKKNETTNTTTSKDSSLLSDNVTSHIYSYVSTEEQLSTQREAVRSLTAPEISNLDKLRKDNREKLSLTFRTSLTAELAVTVCNELLAPLNGGDDVERKRAQRRRNFFRRCLSEAFPSYDNSVTKGRNGGKIEITFIGDEHNRKANSLLVAYNEISKYVNDLPKLDSKSLAAILRKGEPSNGVLDKIPATLVSGKATGNTADVLASIAERLNSVEQEEKKQAQA